MIRRTLLFRIASDPRLALLCVVVLVLLLQVAVGGALGDGPVTPTDSENGGTTGP